jgi:hypothetical protein
VAHTVSRVTRSLFCGGPPHERHKPPCAQVDAPGRARPWHPPICRRT